MSKVVRTTTAGGRGLRAQQAGGGDAVELWHADVHEDDVGAVQVDGAQHAAPVVGLADHLDALRAGQHHPQPRAHERVVVDEQDADVLAHREGSACGADGHDRPSHDALSRRPREGRAQDEVARRVGTVLELAAGELDALGQPDEARAGARERERPGRRDAHRAAADDLHHERAARPRRDRHLDRGARRVLARVGQALLDDAMCHTFCELGATPLSTGLRDVHDFLVTHPAEVVVIVNQDYVTPGGFVEAVDKAGLTPYAFTPPAGAKWPTLREMIAADHRLVVLAENRAGGAPWYQPVYERLTQETPFTFPRASLLTAKADRAASCKPNRGPSSAPLFLINHWVSTDPAPRPSDATRVNAYAPLLARARECESLRHRVPNLLAVNFYKEGDVFRVVDTLNGV